MIFLPPIIANDNKTPLKKPRLISEKATKILGLVVAVVLLALFLLNFGLALVDKYVAEWRMRKERRREWYGRRGRGSQSGLEL